jgi:serine/threonine protein kinase
MVQGSKTDAEHANPDESSAAGWRGTRRYEVVRCIGRGGMGIVYEARDRDAHRRVALKALHDFDPAALLRFKQEFRTLADVQHPNLVRLHEFVGDEGDRVFFSMELIRGTDFLTYVQPGARHADATSDVVRLPSTGEALSGVQRRSTPPPGQGAIVAPPAGASSPADIDRLRPTFRQLVDGVQALHFAGKLHRDIKPSNVLVSTEGRVVLLDFGVATDLPRVADQNLREEGEVVGTAHYMAPEQAFDEEPTPANDWYSVGVMLYEALVGRPPFVGSSHEVIEAKNSTDVTPPSARVQGVPADLDALCVSLLERDPAQRPSGREVLRRIGSVRSSIPASPGALAASAKALVGREAQLGALREAFELARTGRPVAVRVSGRAGMGKSALLQHFLDGLVEHGDAVVLRGRAYERESLPYKAMDAVIDVLSRYLMNASDTEGTLAMPRGMRALARLFPVMRRVPGVREEEQERVVDPRATRRQAFGALRELLTTLAVQRPLVVYIDDVQWGDADSAALLLEMVRPPHAPPMLLVMAHREEDAATTSFLREIRDRWPGGAEVRDVSVGPLATEDSRRLALAILASDDAESQAVAATAAREAGGCPFLIEELTRSATGSLLAARKALLTLEQVVEDRLGGLSEEARRVAEIVAVGGRPLPLSAVGEAAGVTSIDDVVALLSQRRFVHTGLRDGREVVEPIHDRIRETVVAQLSDSRARAHHASLARAFEANADTDPEIVATHLFGAGEDQRAAPFAERAAKRAAAKLAFDQAAQLYARACAATPDGERATKLRVRHAEALVLAGRGVEAARVYMLASQSATAILKSDLERAAAEQLLMAGHMDEGIRILRGVLNSWGMSLPGSPLSAILQLVFFRLLLAIRGLKFEERDPESVRAGDRARIDAMYGVAIGLSIVEPVLSACVQARHMALALDVGHRYQVMRAASLEASHLSSKGGPESPKEQELFALVRRLAEGSSDPETHRAFFESKRGIRLYLRGRWKESRRVLDESYARYAHNRSSANTNAYVMGMYDLWMLGDLAELTRRNAYVLADAEQRGDLYTIVSLRASWPALTLLASDDVEAARRGVTETMKMWSGSRYSVQLWQASVVETFIELYAGAGGRAYVRLQRDARPLKKSFILKVQFVRANTLYVRGIAAAASVNGLPSALRNERIAEVARLSQQLEGERMPWTAPLASILAASAANARGAKAEATAHLRKAAEGAETADMSLYAAAARHQLGRALGGVEGSRLLVEAADAMTAQGIRVPARFASMLVPGQWESGLADGRPRASESPLVVEV